MNFYFTMHFSDSAIKIQKNYLSSARIFNFYTRQSQYSYSAFDKRCQWENRIKNGGPHIKTRLHVWISAKIIASGLRVRFFLLWTIKWNFDIVPSGRKNEEPIKTFISYFSFFKSPIIKKHLLRTQDLKPSFLSNKFVA